MNEPFNGGNNGFDGEIASGSTVPAFSGAFDDDSSRPAIGTDGQPVQQYQPSMYGQQAQQYAPPMYGQQAQQYAPPVYGQQVQQYAPPPYSQQAQQYAPPVYGQPVQQYVPPMYGQPVQQYVPPMYGQPVQQYAPPMYGQPVYMQPVQQLPVLPKAVMDRKLFRKHCTRVGLMLMGDVGLMFAVEMVVLAVAIIILIATGNLDLSGGIQAEIIASALLVPIMLAGGLSAIVGNMTPSALHLNKWRYKFADPFRGDKLNPLFTLAALFTALGLNSAWCYAYYYLKIWFGNFVGYVPENTDTVYTPDNMPLLGMIFYLTWVCVIAPVTEEYMFRGAMLRTLSKYGSGFAIVASAFAFGMMHGNMGQTPMAFLIGLVLGYVAAKSGNIRQSIFIHFVNNVIASLPQILHYFMPDWYDYYANYVEYFDYGTMIFAALALVYFIFRRARGLSSRKKRLASAAAEGENTPVRYAERAWLRLEVPTERRLPQFDSVRHKFCHFLTSGGMIFFILFCLLNIFIVSFLPYILKEPISGMGI